jgi:holo-[acyl-carrier protein] synthase
MLWYPQAQWELELATAASHLIPVARNPLFDGRSGAVMIVSTGVDLIEVVRIQHALEDARTGRRFRERVYTTHEIAYCESKNRGKYESYAGRFAAKEAVMKALGRGWGAKVAWVEIEVARARSGKPAIVLHHKTAQFAAQLGIRNWLLSITHTKDHGLAYVIAQQEAGS